MFIQTLLDTELLKKHIVDGYVQEAHHDTFPLVLYVYSRKAVYENVWDDVTTKCRGLIVNSGTGEIVARPFFKFFNYGSELAIDWFSTEEPVIWEKMDGFLCTQYTWEGRNYIASKGSFHSPHAKWATAWLQAHEDRRRIDTAVVGHTLVFEGLNRDLRIVVDYGLRQELVLLACIHNETGEELTPAGLRVIADNRGLSTPRQNNLTLQEAVTNTRREQVDDVDEGFVATWYRDGQPPFRLKIKYVEYLRLHRLVTGMSPKNIWETLSQGLPVSEYVEHSTPWFKAFFEKWERVFMNEYRRLHQCGSAAYAAGLDAAGDWDNHGNIGQLRKAFALAVQDSKYSSIAFAMLDGKDVRPIIWKQVKRLASNAHTLRDATQ